jgi:hypothetical protein
MPSLTAAITSARTRITIKILKIWVYSRSCHHLHITVNVISFTISKYDISYSTPHRLFISTSGKYHETQFDSIYGNRIHVPLSYYIVLRNLKFGIILQTCTKLFKQLTEVSISSDRGIYFIICSIEMLLWQPKQGHDWNETIRNVFIY